MKEQPNEKYSKAAKREMIQESWMVMDSFCWRKFQQKRKEGVWLIFILHL